MKCPMRPQVSSGIQLAEQEYLTLAPPLSALGEIERPASSTKIPRRRSLGRGISPVLTQHHSPCDPLCKAEPRKRSPLMMPLGHPPKEAGKVFTEEQRDLWLGFQMQACRERNVPPAVVEKLMKLHAGFEFPLTALPTFARIPARPDHVRIPALFLDLTHAGPPGGIIHGDRLRYGVHRALCKGLIEASAHQ